MGSHNFSLLQKIDFLCPLLFTLTAVCLGLYLLMRGTRSERFPPGPWGFPILGHVSLLGRYPPAKLERYRKQYGDVFSLRFGSYPVVVLNGIETIKTALTKRPDDFGGRPLLYTFKLLSDRHKGNIGINIPFGPKWKVIRAVVNRSLRMFANYRTNSVEDIVLEEADRLIDFFLSHGNRDFSPRDEIFVSVGSVIYQILFGRNWNIRKDKNCCAVVKSSNDFVDFARVGNPVDTMPWTRIFFRNRTRRFIRKVDLMHEVLKTQINQHKHTYDCKNIRDVMDALLNAAEGLSQEDGPGIDITKDMILSTAVSLLGAAVDPLGSTLLWAISLMVTYPDVQRRVHEEIKDTLGLSRKPTMADKKRLVFVEATILEIQRFSSVISLPLPRETTVAVEVSDYILPRGTFVLVNQHSTCMDPQVWGDPYSFRPDRFLVTDSKGRVSVNRNLAESFMTFGAGRRRCIGEFLAKLELFLFFTRTMQLCSLSKSASEEYRTERMFGLSTQPSLYKIVASTRC